ncbi:MAG TPA: cupin domain-containing protein [Clostridiales bacterium]|jgi:quercetin dioxygenase-like cupin family protein|nr:cupin domain-containing protein [Clostridiales bacterium]
MFTVSESEKEYRFGDSGPKYLMRGPRIGCGVVVLKPGQDFKGHYHKVMEENFFLLEGQLDFFIDDQKTTVGAGELIHVEPSESHYLINNYDQPAKAVFILGPYTDNDKFE